MTTNMHFVCLVLFHCKVALHIRNCAPYDNDTLCVVHIAEKKKPLRKVTHCCCCGCQKLVLVVHSE